MEDIAASPQSPMAMTTVTGRKRRSWTSPSGLRIDTHGRHQAAGEIRPEPLLLVLEVHEHVRQSLKPANRLRPAFDVHLLISLVSQSKIAIVRSEFDG